MDETIHAKISAIRRPDLPLAVVVGAGGLGTAVARRLGQSHRLMLADRDGARLHHQVEALREEGHDIVGVTCDITAPNQVSALATAAQSQGPALVLAHVVGLSASANDFRAIMAVNLVGAALIADAFHAVLAPGGCGVFISSSAAHMRAIPAELAPFLDAPLGANFVDNLAEVLRERATPAEAYMLSKAALNRMCARHAALWGRRGLRILSVSPGLIATPMGAAAYETSKSKRDLFAAIPLGREGTMLEIAELVAFLASRKASFVSGVDILADGGMLANLNHSTSKAGA